MDFIGGGLPRPPGHPGYPGGLGPFLHTTLDGREWRGGRHADDDSPCPHGIPDDQANGPYPAGGYTCRVTGRPVAFSIPEEEQRPGGDTARPRTWPLIAAAVTNLAAALVIGIADFARSDAPPWTGLLVAGLLGAAAWTGIEASRRIPGRP
jgi:hypothetical protein